MAPTRLEIESPVVETKRRIENPILRTDKLVKIYGGRSVLNGIDIHVNEGEIVGLLGPNGARKTTTFYLIVGLVRPNGGRVYFQDRDVTGFAMDLLQIGASLTQRACYTIHGMGPCRSYPAEQTGL